jgi:hypothetical protein
MSFAWMTVRWFVTFGSMIVTFLAAARDACEDDLAHDLDQCTSFLGNPTYEWSVGWPAGIAVVTGVAVWLLTGVLARFWRHWQGGVVPTSP